MGIKSVKYHMTHVAQKPEWKNHRLNITSKKALRKPFRNIQQDTYRPPALSTESSIDPRRRRRAASLPPLPQTAPIFCQRQARRARWFFFFCHPPPKTDRRDRPRGIPLVLLPRFNTSLSPST